MQDVQPLDVPVHRHERPLAARLFQAAHAHLAAAHDTFDDSEYRPRRRGEQQVWAAHRRASAGLSLFHKQADIWRAADRPNSRWCMADQLPTLNRDPSVGQGLPVECTSIELNESKNMSSSNFTRATAPRILALSATLLLAACGGGDDSDDRSSETLSGGWYSAQTLATWNFLSGGGQLFQGSFDGTACRITVIEYTLDRTASTVTYTIRQAIGTGPGNAYNSGTISDGPYTERYSVRGNTATIGSATYLEVSTSFRPKGCENQ